MALSGGLAGKHPSFTCKDGMVRCTIDFAKLNYADLVSPPIEYPYFSRVADWAPRTSPMFPEGRDCITVALRLTSPIWVQLATPAFRIKMCVSIEKLGPV